jgi:phage-related protein/predicted XRE-type DNA-binding protein
MPAPSLKPVYWMGPTLKDLRGSPDEVKDGIGYALELVQKGERPANAKPLKGFGGASVLEIVADFAGDTWRAVYTVTIADRVYVLHFFQKKVEEGYRHGQEGDRLDQAAVERCRRAWKGGSRMSTKITKSSGNVYADLGLKNADEHALKAEFVRQIAAVMKEQELTQTAAARLLGIDQPDVSKMLRGHFRQFSVERLMRFLVALGRDVDIVVRPVRAARAKVAQLTVTTRT